MSDETMVSEPQQASHEFQQQAEQRQVGLLVELVDFLVHNKKWWLAPIILVLLAMVLLIMLTSSGVAPFIYPLF